MAAAITGIVVYKVGPTSFIENVQCRGRLPILKDPIITLNGTVRLYGFF